MADVQRSRFQRTLNQPGRSREPMNLWRLETSSNLRASISWQGVVPQRLVRTQDGRLILVHTMCCDRSYKSRVERRLEKHDADPESETCWMFLELKRGDQL